MNVSRRGLLRGAGVLLIGSTEMLTGCAPAPATAPSTGVARAPAPGSAGYGELVADPEGMLALPADFRYTVVTHAGVTKLDSGEPTPRNHDGTGAFARPGGGVVLVNNHEIRDPFGTELPVPHHDGLVYDPGAAGGCTVITTDERGNRTGETVGVAGTSTNCAGGVSPWGTWLTCEETDTLAGEDGFQADHGYVFEVDPFDPAANRDPQPIKALGRFEHEAVAVDPQRGHIYLTEDASDPNGMLYRWTPPAGYAAGKAALRTLGAADGELAVMRASDGNGRHVSDLSMATAVGTRYAIEWVPVPDRDARGTAIRRQFTDADATRARKLEGAWWDAGGAYIVSSYARDESPVAHDGQVWFFDPATSMLTLRLLFARNVPTRVARLAFDGPDNISISPHGGVIIAEDGKGAQHLIGATAAGSTFPVARNDFTDETRSGEFVGPVYSPDGSILFAGIQEPGYLFAITGPWRRA
ncbi:MAG: PhoX family protein [Pseudonocardia sp.]|nr:PhoX family protein [Pseudonocardia sp.]